IGVYLLGGLAIGHWPGSHVAESIPQGGGSGMTWLAPFHPIWALLVALKWVRPPDAPLVAHYVWPINRMLSSPETAYMVLTFLVSAGIAAFSTIFVRRGIKQGEVAWWTRLWPRGLKMGDAGEKRRRARRVWSNPVAWREAVTKGSAASSRLAQYGFVVCGAVAGIILLVSYGSGMPVGRARDWLAGLIIVEFVVVMLMGVNTAALAITREREAGTIELLLTTPLTSRYILLGKLLGLVSFTLPLLAVPAATVLMAAVYDLLRGQRAALVFIDCALMMPVLLVVYSAFACMLGLYMSLKCTRSVQAVLLSVGILIAVAFGLFLCGLGFWSGPNEIAAIVSPLTFVASIFALVNPTKLASVTLAGVTLPAANVRVLLAIGSAIAAGLYGAIVAGIYKTMIRDFDMTLRKQFQ
ncbi:MAG: ABC transporter permease subunit, partial [Planctomycetes bacterium]|nr:ABC transporter permease subunit [Planctomycetota bacterium]